jgi:predicted CXXCH cytochrome family protein
VTGDVGPVYPWDGQQVGVVANDGPPDAQPWSAFSYVIGGFGWKARWVKEDGNIYTSLTAQLNLIDGSFTNYHNGETRPYNFACFTCHTTGASDQGEWAPGIAGTFVFGGVQCEECHGQGSQHAFDPDRFDMIVDRSPEKCGDCHFRDEDHNILVSGGYVRHHEQYDEFVHSPHGIAGSSFPANGCVTCHDPHASVVYDDVAAGEGVKATAACVNCHTGYDTNLTHLAIDCENCHMPKAGKSALAVNAYQGDITSHILKINPNPVPKDSMFTNEGYVKTDAEGLASVTLDFACYGCHQDEQGVGGSGSMKTLQELSDKVLNAPGIHGGGRPREA